MFEVAQETQDKLNDLTARMTHRKGAREAGRAWAATGKEALGQSGASRSSTPNSDLGASAALSGSQLSLSRSGIQEQRVLEAVEEEEEEEVPPAAGADQGDTVGMSEEEFARRLAELASERSKVLTKP